MIKTITITSISRKDKTSASGKPYSSLGLKTQEYGDRWLSGFGGKWNQDWQEGDEVTVDVETVFKDGKEYLNFKEADLSAMLLDKVNKLEDDFAKMRKAIMPMYKEWEKKNATTTSAGTKVPDFAEVDEPDEITEADLPDDF